MWNCPICKTTNETNKCRNCGFDLSKDYATHRSICQLSASDRKIFKPVQPGDNILMAGSDTDYVFGRKMDRTKITTIYFRNKKENIGEAAWDVSEKQNGSIMAWTEEKEDGLLDLYIAANGNIMANKDASNMFCKYTQLENISGLEFLQTGRVKDMSHMFGLCENLISLDVSHFDTSQVMNMSGMFSDCYRLKSLDISHFDTSQVTDMRGMFIGCYGLKSLDVSHFNTSQVTDMSYMFSMVKNLFFSHWEGNSLVNLDVSHFDTSQVRNMESMFEACNNLINLDVSHFDTSQVRSMQGMFMDCHNLVNLDVSHFDTSHVIKMNWMFAGCHDLRNLDVSRFDTSQVRHMASMFKGCYNLIDLDVSHFDTSSVKGLSASLSEYFDIPEGVRLKTKKLGGLFRKFWGS